MQYSTFPVRGALEGFVKCFWTLEDAAQDPVQKQRIIPDGCMEMIFHIGDLYTQYLPDETSVLQPRCFVFGQITVPLEIAPTGVTQIFAVRFYPGCFSPFTIVAPALMENKAVPLDALFGEEGKRFGSSILEGGTTEARIELAEKFLTAKLQSPAMATRIVKEAVDTIISINGQLHVNQLAETLQVKRRQLERRFADVVGLSPKQLAKIIRLQSALQLLLRKDYDSLTELSYEGAYYDQSHFIKDFKTFTGTTPGKFYAGNLQLSSLFYGKE